VEPRHYGVARWGVVTWRSRFGVGPVTLGARHVKDDSLGLVVYGIGFEENGAVGVEELVGDVGEDGGAAGGDATFGDKDQEPREELVDVDGGVELGEFGEEVGGEVSEIALVLLAAGADGGARGEVVKAKTKMGIGGVFSAAFAVGEEMLAASARRWSGPTRSRCAGQGGVVF
jgi:hypothetical protein